MQDNILSNIFYKAFEKVIKINLKEGTFEKLKMANRIQLNILVLINGL